MRKCGGPRLPELRGGRDVSGSPAAAGTSQGVSDVNPEAPSPRCVMLLRAPSSASLASRSELAQGGPKRRLNRPDACGAAGPLLAAEEPVTPRPAAPARTGMERGGRVLPRGPAARRDLDWLSLGRRSGLPWRSALEMLTF